MTDAKNKITTLNKDNEKNKNKKLEEGDKKQTSLEIENRDLQKRLQHSRDELERAQSAAQSA